MDKTHNDALWNELGEQEGQEEKPRYDSTHNEHNMARLPGSTGSQVSLR